VQNNTSNDNISLCRVKIYDNESGLIKNTLLGIAVFEVYGFVVERFTPATINTQFDVEISRSRNSSNDSSASTTNASSTNQEMISSSSKYTQASTSIHTIGGFMGGCAHGIIASLWNAIAISIQQRPQNMAYTNAVAVRSLLNPAIVLIRRQLAGMITHHSLSHAVLFGSYEASKRCLLSHFQPNVYGTTNTDRDIDRNTSSIKEFERMEQIARIEYLMCIVMAGGLAGQAQHLICLFTERLFLHSAAKTWAHLHWRTLTIPLAMSFFPSSIAFVAFEYGKGS
jgi:hypothetical protein